jgi:uncharacterized membrane protein
VSNANQKIHFWIYFFLFFVSNCFLSYFPFSYLIKGWIFFLGILIPIVLFMGSPITESMGKEKTYQKEIFSIPDVVAVWAVFGFLAVFIRFFRLTQFYLWPTGDEALHGFLALSLLKKWNWQFFYTVGEHPPLLIWMLALFFKVFKSPFEALWFLPALFSVITIPLGYFCCREFLSKSASGLFAFFLAFSFWPLYSSRFCHQGFFIPFWEFSSFFLMIRWIKSTRKPQRILWPLLLGIWCGLGTLTFISWGVVLLLLLATIFILAFKKLLPNVILFLISLSIGVLPFALAFLKEGYGHHLIDSSALSHWFSSSHQTITHFSYITSLFWGSLQTDTSYGPTWGGILNPILASCFFVGILGLYQKRNEALSKWIGLAFVFCLLPCFLAGDYVELNRIIQVMPFLLLILVLGLQRLLLEIGDRKQRKIVLLSLLFLSFLLDANHLLKPTLDFFNFRKADNRVTSDPNLKAYQILNSISSNQGPGIIFTDFLPVKYGHSLFVTTYPFNSAVNPELNPESASWSAILTNINYQPFLAKRFPESKWYWVENGLPSLVGGLTIGVLPITGGNREVIKNWIKAQMIFHELQLEGEGSYNQKQAYEQSIKHLIESYNKVKGDRFMEACYWEWVSQYFFSPSYFENIAALQKAIQQGYPAVHLYQKLSVLLFEQHRAVEAQRMLQNALEMEPKFKVEDDFEIKNLKN